MKYKIDESNIQVHAYSVCMRRHAQANTHVYAHEYAYVYVYNVPCVFLCAIPLLLYLCLCDRYRTPHVRTS